MRRGATDRGQGCRRASGPPRRGRGRRGGGDQQMGEKWAGGFGAPRGDPARDGPGGGAPPPVGGKQLVGQVVGLAIKVTGKVVQRSRNALQMDSSLIGRKVSTVG